jgi:carbon monoxide dehydrogenase subunit G
MKISGEYLVDADQQKVWEALNDTAVLKQSIPGCQSVDWIGDDEMEATVGSVVGPLKLIMKGRVKRSNVVPPESYTLSGEGSAGPAGHVSGTADVRLTREGDALTRLNYDVSVTIGGKLAQVGSKLVEGTAKRQADQFFRAFSDTVSGRARSPKKSSGLILAIGLAAVVALAVIIFLAL